jgi:hypothetical protein
MEPTPELTLGEKRVRTGFNPSSQNTVEQIKNKTAELINIVDGLPHNVGEDGERTRLKSLAMTAYEQAAMWAVKAATA